MSATAAVKGADAQSDATSAAKTARPSVSIATHSPPSDLTLSERELCDLEMLLMGGFAPLTGFMTQKEYTSVLETMRLPSGAVWTIPIVLPVAKSTVVARDAATEATTAANTPECTAGAEDESSVIKLRDILGAIVAEVAVTDIYEPDVEYEKLKILGSTDPNHPFSKQLDKMKDCYYVGGVVSPVHPVHHFDFKEYRLNAETVRKYIKDQGWECVVAFQTRNPMHKSHFELTRQAMKEASESSGKKAHLLLTPVVGPTQAGDVDYPIRVRCYKRMLPYYGEDSVKLVLLPVAMRMVGPREAVWHAIIRKNFGCTHFVCGRDHAGPSARKQNGEPFYGAYDAHKLLESFQSELGIKPVFSRNMVYCKDTDSYFVEDKLPKGASSDSISGTEVRRMLEHREQIPSWFSFPEVTAELQKFYKPNFKRGICVYFTGLPCAGKSTLAVAVQAALQESDLEQRRITILDADVIRTHLSHGLGFSRQDRQLNVRRIGYVASEVVKHGGICLVANIAPYEEDRKFNRRLVTATGGGYVEVYVSTPLEVCEQRDIKELYKKARLGVIKQFTGISDPYETPNDAELTIDSSDKIASKVERVVEYLKKNEWTR